MNNLEKTKQALESSGKPKKLKWVVITVESSDDLDVLLKPSTPEDVKQSIISGFKLRQNIDSCRVDFRYDSPIHDRTTGGKQYNPIFMSGGGGSGGIGAALGARPMTSAPNNATGPITAPSMLSPNKGPNGQNFN